MRRPRTLQAEPCSSSDPSEARIVCPGCGCAVPVLAEAHCVGCGASLEATLGAARGPPPPSPPRRLTRAQRAAVLRPLRSSHHAWGTFFLFAGAWMLPVALGFVRPLLLLSCIFMGMGLLFRRSAWPARARREQKRRLQALIWGLPAAAELTRVERQVVPMLEAGRLVQLDYVFTVHGQRFEGSQPSPHASDLQRHPRERVWAVYVAESPEVSALWPPGP
ncbi:hypothetical protein [Comamonas sp. JC664]|uniref:hypothetical protein n=1 Tax=Comamonas sp. JC664 TaxID=2801917 RepID=UPI00191FCD92|nr:hypothetical protein [Comamonas sp. JC664]MBL0698748.1 hypothetical protein [Comamonas sp. JC664]GHG78734.1 hypothetical protein GCM10012319_29760 [Comamonas sp. KCTC 72670]